MVLNFAIFRKAFLFIFVCFFISCSSQQKIISVDSTRVLPPVPLGAGTSYDKIFQKWSRNVSFYNHFMLEISGYSVLISPEMKRAYISRNQKNQPLEYIDPYLSPSCQCVTVLLNYAVTKEDYQDFQNPAIWSMALKIQGRWQKPVEIHHYRNKAELAAYFPEENQWSNMYAVVFPIDLESTEKDFELGKVEFLMKSALGSFDFRW